MNPETAASYRVAEAQPPEALNLAQDAPGSLATRSPVRLAGSILAPFAYSGDAVNKVLLEYKTPLTAFVVALVSLPVFALIAAILSVIHSVPLLAPTYELIGVFASTWFVYRHLLFAQNRQELGSQLQSFKTRVVGDEQSAA